MKRRKFLVIAGMIVIAAMSLTSVGALWSQVATAGSSSFKTASIGLDINLNGVDPDPLLVNLGTNLIASDNGIIDLTMVNTGTTPETVSISPISPSLDFLGTTINTGCSNDIPVGGTCDVNITWTIQNTDTVNGQDFDIPLTVNATHGGWKIEKTIEIVGAIALYTPTATVTETETETETPTLTLTSTEATATDQVSGISGPSKATDTVTLTPTPTVTNTVTATYTPVPTDTFTATPTVTDTLVPTDVPTDTPAPTDTSVPTDVPSEDVP